MVFTRRARLQVVVSHTTDNVLFDTNISQTEAVHLLCFLGSPFSPERTSAVMRETDSVVGVQSVSILGEVQVAMNTWCWYVVCNSDVRHDGYGFVIGCAIVD